MVPDVSILWPDLSQHSDISSNNSPFIPQSDLHHPQSLTSTLSTGAIDKGFYTKPKSEYYGMPNNSIRLRTNNGNHGTIPTDVANGSLNPMYHHTNQGQFAHSNVIPSKVSQMGQRQPVPSPSPAMPSQASGPFPSQPRMVVPHQQSAVSASDRSTMLSQTTAKASYNSQFNHNHIRNNGNNISNTYNNDNNHNNSDNNHGNNDNTHSTESFQHNLSMPIQSAQCNALVRNAISYPHLNKSPVSSFTPAPQQSSNAGNIPIFGPNGQTVPASVVSSIRNVSLGRVPPQPLFSPNARPNSISLQDMMNNYNINDNLTNTSPSPLSKTSVCDCHDTQCLSSVGPSSITSSSTNNLSSEHNLLPHNQNPMSNGPHKQLAGQFQPRFSGVAIQHFPQTSVSQPCLQQRSFKQPHQLQQGTAQTTQPVNHLRHLQAPMTTLKTVVEENISGTSSSSSDETTCLRQVAHNLQLSASGEYPSSVTHGSLSNNGDTQNTTKSSDDDSGLSITPERPISSPQPINGNNPVQPSQPQAPAILLPSTQMGGMNQASASASSGVSINDVNWENVPPEIKALILKQNEQLQILQKQIELLMTKDSHPSAVPMPDPESDASINQSSPRQKIMDSSNKKDKSSSVSREEGDGRHSRSVQTPRINRDSISDHQTSLSSNSGQSSNEYTGSSQPSGNHLIPFHYY